MASLSTTTLLGTATAGEETTTASASTGGITTAITGATAAPTVAAATALPSSSQHAPSLAGSVITADAFLGSGSGGAGGSSKLFIRIQNISSSAGLGCRVDLKKIALKCRNTEYNPRRFGAVIMRLREPRATALIFASGKMIVTGVKSTHNATLACQKFAYIIERVGFQPQSLLDFRVMNMVGTADVGFPIRLEGLVYAHSAFASYEPELFPGLIYRLVSPRVVFLIFVSGKIVMTGAKKETDLSLALSKMYPVLVEFKKTHISTLLGLPSTTTTAAPAAAAASSSSNRASDQESTQEIEHV